jgi:prolyl 4-hydroxylase
MDTSSGQPQNITPQLLAWVQAQARLGHNTAALLKAMRASGWQSGVARQAIAATRQERDPDFPGANRFVFNRLLPSLDLGDRQVSVELTLQLPNIVVLADFLSPQECDLLVKAARPKLARSLTVAVATGGEELNDDRTSYGMFFTRGENALVKQIESRIARLLDWPEENGEGLQVLQYRPGAQYKPHYDYFDPAELGSASILQRGGQRVGTLIIYLNTPEQGGATVFPDIGLEIAPQRGKAVFFSYDQPHPSSLSLHGGEPVLAGEKWIATKWLRERKFT